MHDGHAAAVPLVAALLGAVLAIAAGLAFYRPAPAVAPAARSARNGAADGAASESGAIASPGSAVTAERSPELETAGIERGSVPVPRPPRNVRLIALDPKAPMRSVAVRVVRPDGAVADEAAIEVALDPAGTIAESRRILKLAWTATEPWIRVPTGSIALVAESGTLRSEPVSTRGCADGGDAPIELVLEERGALAGRVEVPAELENSELFVHVVRIAAAEAIDPARIAVVASPDSAGTRGARLVPGDRSFAFDGLPCGDWAVIVRESRQPIAARRASVTSGRNELRVTIEAPPADEVLQVRVVDRDDRPVPNAALFLHLTARTTDRTTGVTRSLDTEAAPAPDGSRRVVIGSALAAFLRGELEGEASIHASDALLGAGSAKLARGQRECTIRLEAALPAERTIELDGEAVSVFRNLLSLRLTSRKVTPLGGAEKDVEAAVRPDGRATVFLPPGDYRLRAFARASTFGPTATAAELDISIAATTRSLVVPLAPVARLLEDLDALLPDAEPLDDLASLQRTLRR